MDEGPQRSQSEEAFLRQFMTEERALLRFILRYVPAVNDARDVLQETLVTLWAKRGEFDATREFLPWACGFARFKVKEFWRKQQRWEAFANDELMELMDARREALQPDISARGEKLKACLARLPDGQRAIVHRYYMEDEPVNAIASGEGRSVEAIYKLLQRVRRALLDCIERGLHQEGVAS